MKFRQVLALGGALVTAVVMASCGADSESDLPLEGAYLVRGEDIGRGGSRFQSVSVHRDDAPVSNAAVTVNGIALSDMGDGRYSGELLAILRDGATLALEVRVGERTVTATGAVPEPSELTAPAGGDIIPPSDAIKVTWSSTTNPDRFVVLATPEASLDQQLRFNVAGVARSFTIPAGTLPKNTPTYLVVLPYNDGTFSGPFAQGSTLNIRGFGTSATILISSEMPGGNLLVDGNDMSNRFQNLFVFQNNVVPVPDATVTATGAVPEPPAVTAPADGATFAASAPITVQWTSATNPDRFIVFATWAGTGRQFDAASTARSLTIAAGTLPARQAIRIAVFAYNDGAFSGPFEQGSNMSIRGELDRFPTITISP